MDHVAGDRGLAVRQQIALGVGAVLQFLELVLPVEGDAGRDDIALFGGLDRRLQQRCRGRTCRDRAGSSPRHRPTPGMDTACAEVSGTEWILRSRYQSAVGRLRRAARAVIGHDLALALRLDQRETVAADAGRLRLDHAEQRAGRHRRVRRRAAGPQHLDRRPAPPADARSPPSRSGRGPSTGRRDGNSSCQIAHFWSFCWVARRSAALHGTFMRRWAMAWYTRAPMREWLQGFPGNRRLIDRRHVLQSRRLLSICRAAGFPGAARALARVLRGPRAERQRAARRRGHQRHAGGKR